MMDLRRFPFAALLALGVLLLSTAPAFSNRDIASQQIVPDSEEDLFLLGTGGGNRPHGIVHEPQSEQVVPHGDEGFEYFGGRAPVPDRIAGSVWLAPSFHELVRSVWLLTWKRGILQ